MEFEQLFSKKNIGMLGLRHCDIHVWKIYRYRYFYTEYITSADDCIVECIYACIVTICKKKLWEYMAFHSHSGPMKLISGLRKNIKMFTMYWIKSYKSVKIHLLTSLIVRGYRSNSAIEFRAVI